VLSPKQVEEGEGGRQEGEPSLFQTRFLNYLSGLQEQNDSAVKFKHEELLKGGGQSVHLNRRNFDFINLLGFLHAIGLDVARALKTRRLPLSDDEIDDIISTATLREFSLQSYRIPGVYSGNEAAVRRYEEGALHFYSNAIRVLKQEVGDTLSLEEIDGHVTAMFELIFEKRHEAGETFDRFAFRPKFDTLNLEMMSRLSSAFKARFNFWEVAYYRKVVKLAFYKARLNWLGDHCRLS